MSQYVPGSESGENRRNAASALSEFQKVLETDPKNELATQSIATTGGSVTALTDVKAAISQLASNRAAIGANIETLTDYSNQLATLNNNLSAANSQIMDVDVAQESTNYAKQNILVQTGTAMLAQANALPQIALKLLA